VINTKLPPILHRFQVMADYSVYVKFSLATGGRFSLTPSQSVIPCEYRHKWYTANKMLSYRREIALQGVL